MQLLQGLPLASLVLVPLRSSLSRINSLLEKKHLGMRGGQLPVCRAKGGPGSINVPRRFIQPGPQGDGPAFCFDPGLLQPLLIRTPKVQARLRHPVLNLL